MATCLCDHCHGSMVTGYWPTSVQRQGDIMLHNGHTIWGQVPGGGGTVLVMTTCQF